MIKIKKEWKISGGRYNYMYVRIEELAKDIDSSSVLRMAFKTHLLKVAKACKDIELVDSGNCKSGDEDKAIQDCLGKDAPVLMLAEAVAESLRVKADLENAIPGFMNPEGVIIYHVSGNLYFKKTIEKDEQHKGEQHG